MCSKHNQSVDISENWFIYTCFKKAYYIALLALQIVHFLFSMPVVYQPYPLYWHVLHMRKRSVGKGRQIIKQHCSRVLQYYATVPTGHAGYVLYRALVIMAMGYHRSMINDSLPLAALKHDPAWISSWFYIAILLSYIIYYNNGAICKDVNHNTECMCV